MIDRRGQVWEDRDGALVYLVLESMEKKGLLVFYHRVLFLYADVTGFHAGEQAYEFERHVQPWEETERRRLA